MQFYFKIIIVEFSKVFKIKEEQKLRVFIYVFWTNIKCQTKFDWFENKMNYNSELRWPHL